MTTPARKPQPQFDDLATARQVIATEIAGLQALADILDGDFVLAVEKIDAMKQHGKGRLIIAGIGKSGHIARKMAATLASTGTPSYYVHPGEASHGDLGMITEDDIIIMISNSGESSEQNDLIAHAKRFGIPFFAITSKPASTLGKAADVLLKLPSMPEACPNNLSVPTTSTTMTLALGDALAVALLARSGLTAEQFKVFHPGGKIGAQLLKVSDLMISGDDLAIVAPKTTMDQVIVLMSAKNIGCVVVADDQQKLAGIITDGDLKRHMGDGFLTKEAAAVMSRNPQTILPESLAVEALNHMVKREKGPITSLVVCDAGGQVAGLIRIQECLRAGLV